MSNRTCKVCYSITKNLVSAQSTERQPKTNPIASWIPIIGVLLSILMSVVYASGLSHRSYFLQTLGADSHLFPLDWPETIHWAVDHHAEKVFILSIVTCCVGYGWAVLAGLLDKMIVPLQKRRQSQFTRWIHEIFWTGNARSITIATTSIVFIMLIPIQIKHVMMDGAKVAGMQEATELLATLDLKLQHHN